MGKTEPKGDDKQKLAQLDDKENDKPVPIQKDADGSFVWPEKREGGKRDA